MRVLVWTNPRPIAIETHPMCSVWNALREMPDVSVRRMRLHRSVRMDTYDVFLTWNGLHMGRDKTVPRLRQKGVPVVVVERGFYDRWKWAQIDHRGFNHNASWARDFTGDAPPGSMERVMDIQRGIPTPMRARDSGYVLVLLQLGNDTQLWDGPFRYPEPFLKAIEDVIPEGIELRVRAHPVDPFDCGPNRLATMIGGTLGDAIDGARFVVTINSNAGNDAIYYGCPVLAVGPSVYGYCRAARQTRPENLAADMGEMLDGWTPGVEYAANYCAWLSTKQYSQDEMREGAPVRAALEKAWTSE